MNRLAVDVISLFALMALIGGFWLTFADTALGVAVFGIGAGWMVFRGWMAERADRLRAAGRCVHCGYDLRATPHRCPECGARAL